MKSTKFIAVLLSLLLVFSLASFASAADTYDTADATVFTFTDSGVTAEEGAYDGYKIEGTALTISGAGTYVVRGTCSDGSITVKKGTTGVVLILDGLTLTSSDTAPICCNKSTAVTIVAAKGSVNELTDSETNNDDNYPDNENAENAVIKTKDGSQVVLCGEGTINIVAYGKNGVKGGATTEDEGEACLTIRDLTLNITSYVNDGLKADQELNIESGTITVSAADDGIKSDLVLNIGAQGTDGPTIHVENAYEGIEGAMINIYSGTITVHAEEDGVNAANSDLTDYSYALNIYGGTLYVDAGTGDGLDSNGSLDISGGTVTVLSSAGGDNAPLDSETAFTLSGGTVLAIGASGMVQNPTSASIPYVSFGAGGMMGGPGMGGEMGGQPGDFTQGGEMPAQGNEGGMGGQPGGASMISIQAGDAITIVDENGDVIASALAARAADYVFFASPALSENESYTLLVNGTEAASAAASTQGGMGGPGMGGQPGEMPGNPGEMPGNPGEMPGQPGEMPGNPGEMPGNPGMGSRFSDVNASAYYAQAVDWAVREGITSGTGASTFSPDAACTRAQIVTFLWRAAGSPKATGENPFSDVSSSAYYYDAVLWAVENGITAGTSATAFSPDAACTRAQIVTFLWRAAGSPKTTGENPFTDVSSSNYAYDAILWAVENGVTAGTSASAFSPSAACTRGQIVTFLWRAQGK